jgi:5-methylcytosine-specific restriction endonuclease McrA
MNTYRQSNGERITKAVIDRKTREAKAKVIQNQLNEHGFNFCTGDALEHSGHLTCAHIISVDKAQKQGRSELAFDPENIIVLCTKCHAIYDKNDVRFSHSKI